MGTGLGLALGVGPGLGLGQEGAPGMGSEGPPGMGPAWGVAADSLPAGDFVVTGVRHLRWSAGAGAGGCSGPGWAHRRDPAIPASGGGPHASEPATALPRVEGAGRTLLPLFVDAHIHPWSPEALEQALAFGVGGQLDMFAPPDFLAGLRGEQGAGAATGRADVLGAGYLATAAGGHGTQFGVPIPTVDSAQVASGWVRDRLAEGADWVKMVLEPGSLFGMERPTLEDSTLEALIDAAHDHGLLAVVHVTLVDDAFRAVRAGADGLVHLWGDRVPTEAEVREMAASGLFIVPTLVVQEGMATGAPEGWRAAALLEDPEALPHLDPFARETLGERFPPFLRWSVLDESIRRLRDAGVPLLTGSDAPNPGTVYGASVYRELELLVAAGLTPE